MIKNQETKEEKFKRLATARTSDILRKIKTLGNLSNTGSYDYTEAQINKMFTALERELRLAKEKFKSAKDGGEFKL